MPLPTLSQEADSSTFSFILPAPLYTLILCFHLPSLFLLFRVPTMKRHPPLSYATHSSTHPTRHHITLTATAATPSEHMTRHAQPLPPSPLFTMHYFTPCLSLFVSTSVSPHPHLSRAISATNTHLAIIASQCGLRTPSPLKIDMFNQFCR
jgi:hypothetical protein